MIFDLRDELRFLLWWIGGIQSEPQTRAELDHNIFYTRVSRDAYLKWLDIFEINYKPKLNINK